jgi:hypothetical protein
MQEIQNVFFIAGRGCIVTVPEDDNYYLYDTAIISKDGVEIKKAEVIGIERSMGYIGPAKKVSLQLKGITAKDILTKTIESGMTIKTSRK